MATVPTGLLERELRKNYLQWVRGMSLDSKNIPEKIAAFQASSESIIARFGGRTAALGSLGGFPAPKLLELSPYAGKVYDQMQQAAIQAGILTGISSKEAARAMFKAGLDKSYRRLERLARTETVSAYWKNQWDSTADLPLLVMVWGSEESKRTCQYCLSRDGLVVADSNIRDHPNGRCTLVPTLRSMVKYKGTLQPDGSVEQDPAWTGKKLKTQASAGPTTAEQRDPLSGKSNPAAPSVANAAQASKPRVPTDATLIGSPASPPNASLSDLSPNTAWSKKTTPKYVVDDLGNQTAKLQGTDFDQTIREYTNEGAFDPVNASLRGIDRSTKGSSADEFFQGGDDDDTAGYLKMFTKDLDEAIDSQSTLSEMTLYRGIQRGSIPDLKRGQLITDKGYMSSTADPRIAQGFAEGGDVFRITYPAGRPALYVDALPEVSLNQSEVILPRNLTLKVTNVQLVGEMRVISVTAQ